MDMNHTTIAHSANNNEQNQESMKHLKFTRWLIFALLLLAGDISLNAQTVTVNSCNCTDGERVQDEITINVPLGVTEVWIESYMPFSLPSEVLWRDPIADNTFYLDADIEDSHLDTMQVMGGQVTFTFYRDGNVAFPDIVFEDDNNNIYNAGSPGDGTMLMQCSAVTNMVGQGNGAIDTLCLSSASAIYTVANGAVTVDPTDIMWTATPANAMTGSSTPASAATVAFPVTFNAAGSYTVTATGSTDTNCPIDYEIPVLVIDDNVTIEGFDFACTGDVMPFNLSPNFDAAIFDTVTWTITEMGGATTGVSFVAGSDSTDTDKVSLDINTAGIYEISVAASNTTSSAMCMISDVFTLTVDDTLGASIVGDTVVCIDQIRTYKANVLNIDNISWASTSGTILGSSTADSAIVRFFGAGLDTITVTGMTTSGCEIVDTIIVDIKDSQILLTGMDSLCVGDMAGYRAMYTDASVAVFTDISWTIVPMDVANTEAFDTIVAPNDSLTVTWGAPGDYMLMVDGMTELGCDLRDTFMISVEDTSHFVTGPTLVCVGDVLTYELQNASDSSLVSGTDVTWEVYRLIAGITEVDEALTDMDGDASLDHEFSSGTISKSGFYVVVAQGMTGNGCAINDTLIVEAIGNSDLAINGPTALCSGGIGEFKLALDDSLQTGPLSWNAYLKRDGSPVLPSLINVVDSDSIVINFPYLQDTFEMDTFVIEVSGMSGPSCTFSVTTEVVMTDQYEIIDGDDLETLCLTADSTWYIVDVDTADIDLNSVTWSITNNATGAAVFPAMTGSGTGPAFANLGIAYVYPGPGQYTHRVRGEDENGCEFDEILNVTVKDTTYFLEGDNQICLGDTVQYTLLDANMMPLVDFDTTGMSMVNWLVSDAATGSGTPVATNAGPGGFIDTFYTSGAIGDTINIVWADGGKYELSVLDNTICNCEIDVAQDILVRNNDFQLLGNLDVCVGDTVGYKITNFDSSAITDLLSVPNPWLAGALATPISATDDSITIVWNAPADSTFVTDTLIFSGMVNDSCLVEDTIVINIRSRDFFIGGDINVCQGEPIDMELFNLLDSTAVTDVDSLYWVFSSNGDTIKLPGTQLDVFVDSTGMMSPTWNEGGSFTITAFGATDNDCAIEASFTVNVNSNPNPEIEGDLNTCVNGTDVFSVDIDMSEIASVTWQVVAFAGTPFDGAAIQNGQGTPAIVVGYNAPGNYRIIIEGETIGGCAFSDSLETVVLNAAVIGQLACNNDINVTLPESCELMLTPGQILQDYDPSEIPAEQFEIVVEDAQSGVRLSNGLVDASLIGIELKVIITHECSGQTCWGYITLEDKTVPELLCGTDTIDCVQSVDPFALGFPVADGSGITLTSANPPIYEVTGFEKCGAATLTYEDRISSEVCTGEFGTLIYRDWKLTNSAGLSSECTDTILIRRVNIDSIDLSGLGNFKGEDGFECDEVSIEDLQPGTLTGNLNIFTSAFCFNIQSTFTDEVIEGCSESTYSIIRNWTILDWCSGRVRTHVQFIDVLDKEGPVITLSSSPINISATDHACSGEYDMTPDITVIDACSNPVETTVRIFENDETGSLLYSITNGDYTGLAFDPAITQIFIDVQSTDACGRSNQRSVTRSINIVDDVMPIPICDEETTISIGDQGWAIADWKAFDDGSWDNCGIDKIEVRRMTNNCADFPENLEFGQFVKFCCDDAMLGEEIMVQLRVTDLSGNENVCMVRVTVQDNSVISKVVRENDFAISCSADITEYLSDDGSTVSFITSTCGIPMAPDNFNVRVDTTDCGTGTITRSWVITDELGNTLGHEQIITRGLPGETFDPADLVNIWPTDYTGPGCAGDATSVDAIPAAFRPNIDLGSYACSSLALDHEDLIFRNVEGYCAKVIRTWTLYDWCQRDPRNPDAGKWEYVQILKLSDDEAPVIDSGCETETFAADGVSSCSATVSTEATADDCHDTDDLAWSYIITDAAGTTVLEGSRNDISTILEIGTYTVLWSATDPCGNTGTCEKTIEVVDSGAPTALYRDVTRAIGTDGTVSVNADEFVVRASDNCSDVSTLAYRFDSVDGPTTLNFDCDALQGIGLRTIHKDIFTVDASGNFYMSHAVLTLNDPNDVCGTSTGSTGMIAGQVFTEKEFTVDQVEVTLTALNTGASATDMTPLEGEYSFADVPMNASYSVTASRDDDYLNGVSTLDLVLIQRHILGLADLDSPYKVIAADVNGSGNVSAIDLVSLRRLILGLSTDLPIGRPWSFVDATQTFDNPRNPFPYIQNLEVADMTVDNMDMDFIGVKMGDVNGNVSLQSALLGITRSIEKISVNELSRSGNEVVIGLTPNDAAEVVGLQLALGLESGVEVMAVRSNEIEISTENYNVTNGQLNISWNTTKAVATSGGDLIEVVLSLPNNATSIEDAISLTNERITSEVYTEDNETLVVSDLILEFGEEQGLAFEVAQNVPNPFVGVSTIKFFQPTNGEVEFVISDISGRQIVRKTNTYGKGWNEINVSSDDLPGSGIYIYELSNGSKVVRKKMITID